MARFNKGKARKESREYRRISRKVDAAKKEARRTGEWTAYKALRTIKLQTPSGEAQDPEYRRLFYTRYADDVRHLTHYSIPLGERRSSEEMTSGSLGLPDGENQRGN